MTQLGRTLIILHALPKEIRRPLMKQLHYQSPEGVLDYVNTYINTHVKKSASDPVSVRVYAAVCGLSEENMKARLIADGFV